MLNFLSRNTMRGEKATAKTSLMSHVSVAGIFRITIRLFQFIMGIVVIGLYAQDINAARKLGAYADSKWVYAVFCGSISSLLALVFMVPLIKSWLFFGVDVTVWFFWLVLFGIFGKMFIKEDPEGNGGIIRMKRAVWIDLVNMLLWFFTACWGAFGFWRYRKERTSLTGRGEMHV